MPRSSGTFWQSQGLEYFKFLYVFYHYFPNPNWWHLTRDRIPFLPSFWDLSITCNKVPSKVCEMWGPNNPNQSPPNLRKLFAVKNEVTNGLSLNDYELGENSIFLVKIMWSSETQLLRLFVGLHINLPEHTSFIPSVICMLKIKPCLRNKALALVFEIKAACI